MGLSESEVWIVEDEKELAEAFSDYLQMDCRVKIFQNAKAALDAFDHGDQADLIISDIKMPGMDGLSFVHTLNQKKSTTPVILMSGYAEKYHAMQAISEGIFGMLEKPFDPALLRTLVRKGIQRKTNEQSLSRINTKSKELVGLLQILLDYFRARCSALTASASGPNTKKFADLSPEQIQGLEAQATKVSEEIDELRSKINQAN